MDGVFKYEILNPLQQMSMVSIACQMTHGCDGVTIIHILVVGFTN